VDRLDPDPERQLGGSGVFVVTAESGWLYRASSETCAGGDETLTKSDYEARARVYPLRAAL